jgi:CRISPR-associated protein Cas1
MSVQIVEITQTGVALAKSRGFMTVSRKREEIGKAPIDDIAAVIVSEPGCVISTVLIDHLSRNNIPLVICGQNYLPSVMTLPMEGHNRQFLAMRAQTAISEPKRKRAWQMIVRAKIANQAAALAHANLENRHLLRLAERVRSGDQQNHEAQAARIYWRDLFGGEFRRDRQAAGINATLNYSYAIARACVARAVSAAGLHPSFSLHHKNPQNPLNLVDDLLEPFRPIVDAVVWQNRAMASRELTPQSKQKLAGIVSLSVPMAGEHSPFSLAAARAARSLAAYYLGESAALELPQMPPPLVVAAL